MENVLTKLGLNAKEAQFYLYLLGEGARTASSLSKELGENRTNTYMVLDRLVKEQLVIAHENTPVRTYEAADPDKLKSLVVDRQQQLRQAHSSLSSVLPELASIYSLGQHKPGVVYLEGIAGYKQSLTDMAKSQQQVSVLGSHIASENHEEAWDVLEEYARGRTHEGSHSRILLSQEFKGGVDAKKLIANGYELRFWGVPHAGEVAIYGNKIALTVYEPALVVTVITNEVLAQTFRVIYDQLWALADCE